MCPLFVSVGVSEYPMTLEHSSDINPASLSMSFGNLLSVNPKDETSTLSMYCCSNI